MLTSEAMGLQEHRGVLLLPQARCGVMSLWGRGHSAVPRTTDTVLFPEPLDNIGKEQAPPCKLMSFSSAHWEGYLTYACLSSLVLYIYIYL